MLEQGGNYDFPPPAPPARPPILPGAGGTCNRLPRGCARRRHSRRFDAHLTDCDGCTAYVEQMRETIRLVGRLDKSDIPAEGRAKLMEAFRDWRAEQG